ncbi:MAG: ATP-binding protein, partial [Kiritimatiellae bacterium]|nr:ATP-binding protein [Kiritimatiellia bacterium]
MVGLLLLAILAVVIWNRALQRMVDRKSRQLLKGEMAQIKSALRVNERTRLAVELHDSLSQNLSGVACQIAATKGTLPDGADAATHQLETAERMLLSCRTELRRCLWDLRGDALEEKDFAEAVRKTIAPVAIGTETQVRFDVSRARLSDTTAHAILCIIRELVSNAVRHGHANTVRIAGEFHDGALSFSVRDDGCGFDVDSAAGANEGHFGLEGIRERAKRLD